MDPKKTLFERLKETLVTCNQSELLKEFLPLAQYLAREDKKNVLRLEWTVWVKQFIDDARRTAEMFMDLFDLQNSRFTQPEEELRKQKEEVCRLNQCLMSQHPEVAWDAKLDELSHLTEFAQRAEEDAGKARAQSVSIWKKVSGFF